MGGGGGRTWLGPLSSWWWGEGEAWGSCFVVGVFLGMGRGRGGGGAVCFVGWWCFVGVWGGVDGCGGGASGVGG